MARQRSPIRYGRIIYAWMRDHRGHSKLRPAGILSPDEAIKVEDDLVIAAITTTYPEPPPANHVPLPWNPRGSVSTRLKKRSAIVINWQAIIHKTDIVAFGGDIPFQIMAEIETRLAGLDNADLP